jgi:hypothetical protein
MIDTAEPSSPSEGDVGQIQTESPEKIIEKLRTTYNLPLPEEIPTFFRKGESMDLDHFGLLAEALYQCTQQEQDAIKDYLRNNGVNKKDLDVFSAWFLHHSE